MWGALRTSSRQPRRLYRRAGHMIFATTWRRFTLDKEKRLRYFACLSLQKIQELGFFSGKKRLGHGETSFSGAVDNFGGLWIDWGASAVGAGAAFSPGSYSADASSNL